MSVGLRVIDEGWEELRAGGRSMGIHTRCTTGAGGESWWASRCFAGIGDACRDEWPVKCVIDPQNWLSSDGIKEEKSEI